jgi:hypothetical protein
MQGVRGFPYYCSLEHLPKANHLVMKNEMCLSIDHPRSVTNNASFLLDSTKTDTKALR